MAPDRASRARGRNGRARRAHRYSAATADKYDLYQKAVQSPELDLAFLERTFRRLSGREPRHFREDFCGSALLSATWIGGGPERTAEGFDLDPDPVAWGLAHNFEPLGQAARRFTVHLKDVRSPGSRPADLRVAQNFSYFVFKTRPELLGYFRAAREDLAPDGLFALDLLGGSEATEEMEEETRLGGFTYVWEQAAFWPGTAELRAHIHFRFPDGTEIRRAFSYDWRLWTLPEVKDALDEAGFASVETYFEGTDEKGTGGNGVFRRGKRGENCLSWIAYVVAAR